MYKRIFGGLAVLLFLGVICFRLVSDRASSLVVGVVGDNPPFSYKKYGNKGDLVGFDVDLVKAIARVVKKEPEFKVGKLDDLLGYLKSKKIDLIVGGVPASHLSRIRDKDVSFVGISYDAFSVHDSDCLLYPKALKGKVLFEKLAVQAGTSEEIRCVDNRGAISSSSSLPRIIKTDSLASSMDLLGAGDVDAIYVSNIKFSYIDSLQPGMFLCSEVSADDASKVSGISSSGDYAMIFLKSKSSYYSSPNFKKKFSKALKRMKDGGDYDAIKMLWVTGESEEDVD